jgi:hypothetical protein
VTEIIHSAEFAKLLNTTFTIKTENKEWKSEMVKFNSIAEPETHDGHECFTMEFLVNAQDHQVMPQSIYEMEHESLGSLSLFLVPVEKNESGVYYQAVINRI